MIANNYLIAQDDVITYTYMIANIGIIAYDGITATKGIIMACDELIANSDAIVYDGT